MQTRFSISFWSLLLGLFLVPLACVDQDFDQPPVGGNDPNLPVNISIAEIKATHTLDAYEEITEDWTFSGIVISDDAEGNFFKQLVIQDSTGGIEMRIEMTNLSNVYPVGRKVYVKAKGLYLGDYNGLIQLGAGIGTGSNGDPELIRIPESILGQYIVTATYGNPTPPKVITIDQLDVSDVSTLVQFDNVQFIGSDAGQTYADAVLQQSLNREIEDCAKRRVIIRTSGFATFAGDTTPTKNGTLVGVLGIFGTDFQLTLRDLDDVNMTGDRCGVGNVVTIESIRNQFTGSQTTLTGGTIRGVVISDFSSASVTGRNLYIQDATGGIVLRFDANHSFALGNEILVDLSGGLLGEFNGLLQVDGITLGSASLESNPGDVTPRTSTVAEVLANAQAWESTLVEIKDATLSGTTTYNGSVTVTDASGAMIMFTRSQATFSGDPLPSGVVTVKAIVSEFNSPQLIIRNTNDVTGGGGGGGGDVDEDFTGLSHNTDINLSGWANIAVKGSRLWRSQIFSGNTYAQATAFNDAANEMESWLITPPIELDVAKQLNFESAYGFYTHDGLTVWISNNFNGTDVNAATWTQLSPTLAQSSDTEHAFIPSGNVNLSGFSGTVRIGFKYVGSGPGGQTTSWRIDNVKVTEL
jgi:hypothetical protein